MFVQKTMTRKLITVSPDTAILDARRLMDEHKIRHLPVVDSDGKLLGIVTDRDIRSALPSLLLCDEGSGVEDRERLSRLPVSRIMTPDPMTVSPYNTLEDALLFMQKKHVGAFPVVDEKKRLVGILSIRDLLRAFVNVLGIEEPGTLLGILVEDKIGQMKRIVDAITEERISFGSILVARHWQEGRRAVFPYLLTGNTARVKKKLRDMGFELLSPMEWTLDSARVDDSPTGGDKEDD